MNQDETMTKVLNKLDYLTSEFAGIRTDINDLKDDVRRLEALGTETRDDVRRLEVLHEETDDKIQLIFETLTPNSKQIIELEKHNENQDEKIQFHDRRIGFLEKKVA